MLTVHKFCTEFQFHPYRQKVSLYKHADDLENDLSQIATGKWIDSGKVTTDVIFQCCYTYHHSGQQLHELWTTIHFVVT